MAAAMTLREMLSEVLGQSGFIQKNAYAGSVDVDDIQMVSIANRVAQEIRDYYPWEELRKEHVLNLTTSTLYNLPSDFKQYIPNSGWQDEGSRQIELPTPDGRWYMYKNSAFSDGGTYRCRLRGNAKQIEVYEPDAGQSIVFYYVSDAPVERNDGSLGDRFVNDLDKWILDDQTLILGIQAHWAQTKLLPQYQEWMANFRAKLNESIGRSAGGRTIGGFTRRNWQDCRSPYYPLWRGT